MWWPPVDKRFQFVDDPSGWLNRARQVWRAIQDVATQQAFVGRPPDLPYIELTLRFTCREIDFSDSLIADIEFVLKQLVESKQGVNRVDQPQERYGIGVMYSRGPAFTPPLPRPNGVVDYGSLPSGTRLTVDTRVVGNTKLIKHGNEAVASKTRFPGPLTFLYDTQLHRSVVELETSSQAGATLSVPEPSICESWTRALDESQNAANLGAVDFRVRITIPAESVAIVTAESEHDSIVRNIAEGLGVCLRQKTRSTAEVQAGKSLITLTRVPKLGSVTSDFLPNSFVEPSASSPSRTDPSRNDPESLSDTKSGGQIWSNDLIRLQETQNQLLVQIIQRLDRLQEQLAKSEEDQTARRARQDSMFEAEAVARQRLENEFGRLATRVEALLRARTGQPAMLAIEQLIGKPRQVFEELTAIEGKDSEARKKAQELLNHLEGELVSEPLVNILRVYLKDKEWGILQPSSGIVAGPVWQRNLGSPRGGYMRLSYTQDGRPMKGKTFTIIPKLTLVQRNRLGRKA
jgi:hypothetical protein